MKQKNIKDTKIKNKRKKRSLFGKILLTIIVLLLIGGIAYAGYFIYKVQENGGGLSGVVKTAMGYDENKKKNMQPINILVLGESGVGDGYKLTDTIILCSYNPKLQKASMLSIPRDTYVGKRDKNSASQMYLASYKMNSVYRNGTNIEETIECVGKLTGLDLKYYVLVDTDALIKAVDTIGGVNFNVPIDMDYDDPTQDLHIHLKAGMQLLDGDKAEQLVRFRHNNDGSSYPMSYGDNDLGRMRTQREFIEETAKQLMQAKNIFQLKNLIDIGFESIKTNLDIDTIKDYVPYGIDFNMEDLQTETLPGVPELVNGVWIYTANKKQTNEIIDKMFLYKEEEQNISKQATSETTFEEDPLLNVKMKVEVLDGTGKENSVEKLKDKLKQYGYDIEKVTKTNIISNTQIVCKNKTLDSKYEELKHIIKMGLDQKNKYSESSKYDFTIILGQDYN